MIDHVWTVVCSQIVIDRDSNNVSLQNIIEQINIRAEPMPDGKLPIVLHTMTLWVRTDSNTPARGRGRVKFVSPSGQAAAPLEFDINLSEYTGHRTRGKFGGLPVTEPGRYSFRVDFQEEGEDEWRQVASVPVEVIFTPPESEQEEPE